MKLAMCLFVICAGFGMSAYAESPVQENPVEMIREIGIDQKLDTQLPLHLRFTNEDGMDQPLSAYFKDKPVILMFVYYQCPMLCDLTLNGLVSALRTLRFSIGREFDIVTVSISPVETPEMAREKKRKSVKSYNRPEAVQGWHFLTGKEKEIHELTEAAGFRYVGAKGQFAHASAIIIATPEGRLSKYFSGVEFSPKDIRLALIEASEKKIGSFVDQILLLCYHYDPKSGKYGVAVTRLLRAAGVATLLILGTFVTRMLVQERAKKNRS